MLFIAYSTPILFTNCELKSLQVLNILYSKSTLLLMVWFTVPVVNELNFIIRKILK